MENKMNEYNHANKMKKEEKKVIESAESFMELAFKKRARVNQNSQSKPLKPCRDRAQKAPRTEPLNSNIVINSQMGAP